MSAELLHARARLSSQRDQRVVRERRDIEVSPSVYSKNIYQLGKLEILSPCTAQLADELCDQLTAVMHTMDQLYADLQEDESIVTDKLHCRMLYVRDAMMQQFCCTDPSMLENYRFLDGATEHHYRFDIMSFLALIEAVACLATMSIFWESLSVRWGDGVVPAEAFPQLCEKTVISRNLHRKPIAQFNVFDLIDSLKYLEFKWCIIKYSAELPIYLDLLLARITELYKNPQPYLMFSGIDEYMRPISETEAVFSDRLIEELCWSLRPMYQKVVVYERLAKKRAVFHVPEEDRLQVQTLASANARRMNNKKVSEEFRDQYLRFALRPSEMQRFYRDKRGAYANGALIMKNTRQGDSVNRIMDKLDNPAWVMVDRECDEEVRKLPKPKGVLERSATDMMYLLLVNSWLGNLWQLELIKVFVVYNLDLLEGNTTTRFRVDYPLLVQSFNHFDVYYLGTLYTHESLAKAFCHWYSIMMRPPFNGRFDNRSLESYELKDLRILQK